MYLHQKTNYDCGPISVLNYLIYRGYAVTNADIPKMRKMLATTKRGTPIATIAATIATYNPEMEITQNRKTMIKHLVRRGAVLVTFQIKGCDHIVLCLKHGRSILILNFAKNARHVVMTRVNFRKFLKKSTIKPIYILA